MVGEPHACLCDAAHRDLAPGRSRGVPRVVGEHVVDLLLDSEHRRAPRILYLTEPGRAMRPRTTSRPGSVRYSMRGASPATMMNSLSVQVPVCGNIGTWTLNEFIMV